MGLWLVVGLGLVMALVLLLPFLVKKVEEELEAFLFIMGVLAVSVSGLWTSHLIHEALVEPIKISVAVLIAGFVFRGLRDRIKGWVDVLVKKFGYRVFFFLLVAGLGLMSSVITAIIAALVLAEVITTLKLNRKLETQLVIITCYAIGLGAVLTPIGEPLATIAVAKLKGDPYHADFYFLFKLLGVWVIPMVAGLGIWAMFIQRAKGGSATTLREDKAENIKDVVVRALKVYLFVMALVLLGTGFKPVIDSYLVHVPGKVLYWINMISAVLDNATLTAAEISPVMSLTTIRDLLLGLLIAGGMLIPGNIPNIICAGKLGIRSKEWAQFGLPLGLGLMLACFIILLFV